MKLRFNKLLKIKHVENSDIWVIRILKNGKIVNSEPCLSCIVAMKRYGIKRVFYSNEIGDIICIKLSEITVSDCYMSKLEIPNKVLTCLMSILTLNTSNNLSFSIV